MSRKVDWKKERRNFREVKTGRPLPEVVPWNDTGKTVLKRGKRSSVGNDDSITLRDIAHFLEMMEINRKDRAERLGKPKRINITPYRDRLKGLMGGGR